MRKIFLILFVIFQINSLSAQRVKTGADVLFEKYVDSLSGKRVAVVCNQSSVLSNGKHIVDSLIARHVAVTTLFAPEHGIRGTAAAGAKVESGRDPVTGLPLYSLYGKTQKPTPEMLANVDVILFDLQDVGARFYTYASTMSTCMEAARDNGKKIIILDRPNPIDGVDVEGPVLDMDLLSFLGLFPIPVRHGLTLGELAKMIVGEGWLNYDSQVDLTVIPMEGWKRSMWFDQTGLPWVAPSPSMKSLSTATVYPGTCLFEATNVSEGRGTGKPFEYIGAPRLDGAKVAANLNAFGLPGVVFEPAQFTPEADTPAVPDPPYNKKRCGGVYLRITDRNKFRPVLTGVIMLSVFRTFPKFQLRQGFLDHLVGDRYVGEMLERKGIDMTILKRYQKEIDRFRKMRQKYLLYSDR